MRFDLKVDDFKGALKHSFDDVELAVTDAMNDVATGLKDELREQVVGAGLGRRLANTWRAKRFPEGRPSSSAAAFVWSKAPDIIDGFDRGPLIRTVNGRKYLAIPTENVPARRRGSGGKGSHMSPEQVEIAYNQDLHFAKTSNGRLIAYVEVIGAKNQRGFRPATPKRLAQGRKVAAVVMFILVPTVQMRKRLDVDGAANRWADRVAGLIALHWR